MRLFVAVDFPSAQLQQARDLLQIEGVKAVEHFHLTLKFLGEVQDSFLSSLIEQLKTISYSSFACHLTHVGGFPSVEKPRVIWVGVDHEREFVDLHEQVDATLSQFPKEERFSPHVTLARVKFIEDGRLLQQRILDLQKITFHESFSIQAFTLYRSDLRISGPVYTALERFNLD